MYQLQVLLVGTLCLVDAFSVKANDTMASVSATEIDYKITQDIAMQKEELNLSLEEITVSYEFFNHADHDITSDVAFPLPTMTPYSEIWDEQYFAYKKLRVIHKKRRLPFPLSLKPVPF